MVKWRPQVAPYHIEMKAKTVAAGKPTTLSVSPQTDGPVVVSGNIAADAGKQLRVAAVDDPAALARTALIEALGRAGVSVSASPTGSNPSSELPKKGSYKADDQGRGLRVSALQPVRQADPQGQPQLRRQPERVPDGRQGGQHRLQRRLPRDEVLLREGGRRCGSGGPGRRQGVTPRTASPPRRRPTCFATGWSSLKRRSSARCSPSWCQRQPRVRLQGLPREGQGLRQARDGRAPRLREREPCRQ